MSLFGAQQSRKHEIMLAETEAVEWDEYGQAYSKTGEVVFCICGEPFPYRKTHYCPYDKAEIEYEG